MRIGMRMLAALAAGALLAVVLVVSGCGSPSGPSASQLDGAWRLEAFGGTTALVPADPAVTTEITFAAGKATGNGGVNTFSGTYDAKDGGSLTFGPIAATAMAGPEPANQQEAEFFAALDKTRHFEFNGKKLVLADTGNNTLMTLAPK
jgi:heat shock protein HslJ